LAGFEAIFHGRFWVITDGPTTKRKKRASHLRVVPPPSAGANERWCMDFVSDRLEDGHYFRMLTVVDVFSRRRQGSVCSDCSYGCLRGFYQPWERRDR
jgi:hypothetical protein